MGLPAYIYNNPIESCTLSSSTANSAFPLANIKDRIKANPFKFTTNGGYVEADAGGNFTFDSIVILGHNMPSLVSSATAAGASPNPGGSLGTFTYRAEDMWLSVASTTARYVRVTVATPGDPTAFGELVVETRVAFPRACRWGIVPGTMAAGITHRTYGGVTWDYEFYSKRYLRPTFRFPESELAQFELFSTRVARRPFVWIPDVSAAAVYYVKKQRGFDPQPIGPARDGSSIALWYDWTLELEAESIGLVIT